jgi:hypothetical protein
MAVAGQLYFLLCQMEVNGEVHASAYLPADTYWLGVWWSPEPV